MSRSRTVSFKGAAAGAFVNALMGKPPADDDEKLERVATFVFGHVKEGLDAACKAVSK